MSDYKQLIISLTIALLFVFFVNATIEAINESPSYSDFCDYTYPNKQDVSEQEMLDFNQKMDECRKEFDLARENNALFVFFISSIFGLIAIFSGLFIPKKDSFMRIVSLGLLIGGLLALFVGTIRGWEGISIYFRPLVLLLEIILVVFITYKFMKKK